MSIAPKCTCRQTDVELFDCRGCELHDDRSEFNRAARARTMVEKYERAIEEAA